MTCNLQLTGFLMDDKEFCIHRRISDGTSCLLAREYLPLRNERPVEAGYGASLRDHLFAERFQLLFLYGLQIFERGSPLGLQRRSGIGEHTGI